ncbi:MAG: hypothetical protein AMXMBFR64_37040 [Myxococcales bacterium]
MGMIDGRRPGFLHWLIVPQEEPPGDYEAWRLERWRWTHLLGAVPGTVLLVVAPLIELLVHWFVAPLPMTTLVLVRLAGVPLFLGFMWVSARYPRANHLLLAWLDHLAYCGIQALVAGLVDRATGQPVYVLAGFLIGAITAFYPSEPARAAAFPLTLGASMAAIYLSVIEGSPAGTGPTIVVVLILVVGMTSFGLFGSLSLDRALRGAFATQVQLTSALVQAEAGTRAKSEFLANMSHEIRTPLNGVLGMTSLLLHTPLSDQQRRYMDAVRSSGEALLAILNDVLDFSKIEAGRLTLVDADFTLEDPVADVAELNATAAHAKGLEIVHRVAPSVPARVRGDAGRLRQVLGNLVTNAVKFTHSGRIQIDVEPLTLGEQDVTLHFTVSDTGVGIDPDQQRRIFEPFTQVDASLARTGGGAGLGLAISRQIVHAMGGELGVESEPGTGSRFWFSVRLLRADPGPAVEPIPGGGRALVVDHDEVVAWVLRDMLERQGVAADACDFSRALRELQARRAAPPRFLVVDAALPGCGARALIDALRADPALAAVRVILTSPFGVALRAADLGASAHATLARPVRSATLRASLHAALAAHTHGEAPVFVAPPGALPLRAGLERPTLLVVEDNAVNRMLVVEYLQLLGCDADVAQNGLEALDALARRAYAAILMDCHMPEMDGYEATAAIRRLPGPAARTPIIAVTADALAGDRERTLSAGMDDHLSKPVRLATLREVLDRWLSSAARPDAELLDTEAGLGQSKGSAGGEAR